jgi:hypothetical protein
MDESKQRRFLWGMLLAWVPLVPLIPGLLNAFRGISAEKATGLAAVAGGLAEYFVTFGLGMAFVFAVLSIVMLLGTFSKGHWVRGLFSVLSICWSALLIVQFSFFIWMSFFWQHRR